MDRRPSDRIDEGAPGAGAGPAVTAEWPKKAADLVDRLVGLVHDKAVRPVALIARAVVFGLLVAALGTVVLILLSISLLRLLDVYAFETHQWASYLLLGAVFSLFGSLLWAKRFQRGAGHEAERL